MAETNRARIWISDTILGCTLFYLISGASLSVLVSMKYFFSNLMVTQTVVKIKIETDTSFIQSKAHKKGNIL